MSECVCVVVVFEVCLKCVWLSVMCGGNDFVE